MSDLWRSRPTFSSMMLTEPKSHFSCPLVCFVSVVLCKPWGSRGQERFDGKEEYFLLPLHDSQVATAHESPWRSAKRLLEHSPPPQDPNSCTRQAAFRNKQSQFCKDGAGCISAQRALVWLLTSILHRALVTQLGRCCFRDNPDLSCLQPQIASGKTASVLCRICLSCSMRKGCNALQRLSQAQYIQQTTPFKKKKCGYIDLCQAFFPQLTLEDLKRQVWSRADALSLSSKYSTNLIKIYGA